MCQLYSGDVDGGTKALKKLSKDSPDYGPVWQYLGIVYEYYQGDTDAAKEAYQKAVEADPNDEYGAKSQADRRLAALAAAEGGDVTADAAGTTDATTTDGAEALENALDSGL
jgi:tetratricopeptide (TPR) repeat protein